MTDTIHLGMPFIEGSQAQKHVTHNEALRILDAVIQIGVRDTDRTAPPLTPAEGDRHIVASGATGAWAGQANAIAAYEDGAWRFLSPKLGWCAWSEADGALLVYDGAAWTDVASGGGGGSGGSESLARLGVNDTASDPNLLTVKSNAALFTAIDTGDGGNGDMRLQLSKEASGRTASVVFSDAFSGRAEFGLVGSNAFKLKVSNDGTTFVESLVIDQTSGNAALPHGLALTGVIAPPQITSNQNDYNPTGIASASVLNLSSDALRNVTGLAGGAEGMVLAIVNTGSQIIKLVNESASSTAANRFAIGSDLSIGGKQAALLRYDGTASRWYALARPAGREVLTANRTYYVRTDGSDSNDGLSNTSGGAFLTIQKVIDVAATIDFNNKTVTIQIADGTYAAGGIIPIMVGQGSYLNLVIQGNATTPANVVISTTSASCIQVVKGAAVLLKDFKIQTTTSGNGIFVVGGYAGYSGINFGTCANRHMRVEVGGIIECFGNYAISGNAMTHVQSIYQSFARINGFSISVTNSPAFSTVLQASTQSVVWWQNMTVNVVSGSAISGSKYDGAVQSAIQTFGGGSSSVPGGAVGTLDATSVIV